ELLVGALSEKHFTHAAAPEAAHDAVRPDALSGEVNCVLFGTLGCYCAVFTEPLLARLELVHGIGVQIAVSRASLANEAQALVRRQRLRLIENLLQGLARHRAILRLGAVHVLRSS